MLARLWATHLLFTAYEHWVWSSCVDRCTFTHICCFYSGSTIHIYPLISISRTTQKNYSTPNPGENSQKYFYFSLVKWMLKLSCYYHLLYYLKRWVLLKKEKKEKIRANKKGQVPGTSKEKEKVRREVKMDKCPTVELGVQDTHLRGKKKKKIEHLILLIKFQKARKLCIPSKEQK